MEHASLQRLAEDGFAGVPVDQFRDLSNWCWDWSEVSGDARFCSLARVFGAVDSWYSEHDAVPRYLAGAIEELCLRELPAILAIEDPVDASPLARSFRQQVLTLLLQPDEWEN